MCDCGMECPVPLGEADLTRPFVYERRWGVFYVPMGMHPSAMSLLLAFQYGLTKGLKVAERLSLDYSDETADYWLKHTPGAAFRSSVGKRIQVGSFSNMTVQERRAFSDATCVFEQSEQGT